jgi:hypothetical protein
VIGYFVDIDGIADHHHLEQNSIIVSLGSINIIDATVIKAKQSRNRKCRNGNNTQDPEADYNVKIAADVKLKSTYGYKMHANTDEDGFVKKMTYTPGLKRQMVEWSGTASLKLKSMKRLNIKSLAICFSKASSLSAYQA